MFITIKVFDFVDGIFVANIESNPFLTQKDAPDIVICILFILIYIKTK